MKKENFKIIEFANEIFKNSKPLDEEFLKILKQTARRVLSKTPTKFEKKETVDKILSPDKEYEILRKEYVFDKYQRKLMYEPYWRHYKYYKTYNSAQNAIIDIRKNYKYPLDYPGYGNIESEKLYPHITPQIRISRFKIIKKNTK